MSEEPCTYLDVVINQAGGGYTTDDRIRAVIDYCSTGNIHRTAINVSVPARTLYGWYKTEWWTEILTRFSEENKDELNAGYRRILSSSMQVIENKLKTPRKISIMDAVKTHTFIFNTRQILNNQPTSISSTIGSKELDKLRQLFEDQASKTINGQVV